MISCRYTHHHDFQLNKLQSKNPLLSERLVMMHLPLQKFYSKQNCDIDSMTRENDNDDDDLL